MPKKPTIPSDLCIDSKLELANKNRRAFVKTVAAGVTSISFAKSAQAAGESSLPSIVSLLLDEPPIGVPIRFDATKDNKVQSINIPSRATTINVQAYGAGGAGSIGNFGQISGAAGGNGGSASAVFRVSDLSKRNLTIHIGEGATAGEAYEASTAGAFGGGAGGATQFTGGGAISSPTFGGAGGGYTGLFSGNQVLTVGGGGGGGGGVGHASGIAAGAGGSATNSADESRAGNDGVGPSSAEGGTLDIGGVSILGAPTHNGGDASNFIGGTGGISLTNLSPAAGGAGGGGGAGYSDATSWTGGGGGGGAARAIDEGTGGAGGGGAGGTNYFAPYAFGEPSDFGVGAAGGSVGFYQGSSAGSGAMAGLK